MFCSSPRPLLSTPAKFAVQTPLFKSFKKSLKEVALRLSNWQGVYSAFEGSCYVLTCQLLCTQLSSCARADGCSEPLAGFDILRDKGRCAPRVGSMAAGAAREEVLPRGQQQLETAQPARPPRRPLRCGVCAQGMWCAWRGFSAFQECLLNITICLGTDAGVLASCWAPCSVLTSFQVLLKRRMPIDELLVPSLPGCSSVFVE
jgi:hypothetical protein